MSETTERIVYVQPASSSGGWVKFIVILMVILAALALSGKIKIASPIAPPAVISATQVPFAPFVPAPPVQPARPAQQAEQAEQAQVVVVVTAVATPAPAIVVPRGLPENAKMPTATLLPTVAPQRYPSASTAWTVRQATDGGYIRDCVYLPAQRKRVCWAPGVHPSDADAAWVVGMVEAGNIAGEAIPADQQ